MTEDPAATIPGQGQEPAKLPAATLASVRKSVRINGPAAKKARGRSADFAALVERRGDRDPVLVGPGLADLVIDRGWTNETAVAGLIGRWAELVGEHFAAHVKPESFDADTGSLRLTAESTTWATQVKMLIPTLQNRLDIELGADVVRQIEVCGPAAPYREFGKLRVPGRGPRDTYG
jgi:predicted nucleic acid-binding Zn ribbon protein